ncbi:MAG: hypothetical protein HY703_05075, partial [Gemmatimonadetes bacterium]|nr:hypothetical protein [Gemmatimonadota bacterium]
MGLYDDITPEALRADLRRFAELVLRLEAEGRLLEATPRLIKLLGDLRAKLFAYEIRGTHRLAPPAGPQPVESGESGRIVQEARERSKQA